MAHWKERAACAVPGIDPTIFHPREPAARKPVDYKAQHSAARAICESCPVGLECEAEGFGAPGIWNGKTEYERRPPVVRKDRDRGDRRSRDGWNPRGVLPLHELEKLLGNR
jgi:hypothetical protein